MNPRTTTALHTAFHGLSASVLALMLVACSPAAPDDSGGAGVLLERLPLDLDALDYAAMVAHDAGRDADWLPLQDYGLVFPANEHRPLAKTNPQPTFYAPLGTAVVAIVSGVVTSTPRLYSGDSSVMIAAGGGPVWEMEHVIKVRVRPGDRVEAGDTIAEVSDYECVWGRNGDPADPVCASGLGLVEIGLLYPGNPPEHRCPFELPLVAPDRVTPVFSQLDSARARVEAAFGGTTKYDETIRESAQCITHGPIPG